MKAKETAAVAGQEEIAENIFSLVLHVSFADACLPGQFVSLFSKDASRLLPRPISICDRKDGKIRLVYRIAGAGTEEFSHLVPGDGIEVMGPLGNGFPIGEMKGRHVLLTGGGIGIPPMLFAAKGLLDPANKNRAAAVQFAVGYRSETYLYEDLKKTAPVLASTEDGSFGTKGTVLDALRENGTKADAVFACGPKMMLSAIRDYARENAIPCWVSMEERMACGIGACLGCVCESTGMDEHSHVNNKRVCRDGPVFRAEEVVL